jgi:hypothetical protein
MAPELGLSAVAGMADGDTATVTGWLRQVIVRRNRSVIPTDRAILILVDPDLPEPERVDCAVNVNASAAAWKDHQQHLTEGSTVTLAVAASRDEETGLALWLTAAIPPAGRPPAGRPPAGGPPEHHAAPQVAAARREELREAVLDGSLTPDQAAELWPAADPHKPIAVAANQLLNELGHTDPAAEPQATARPEAQDTQVRPAGAPHAEAVPGGRVATAMYESGVPMTPQEAARLTAEVVPLFDHGRPTWGALTAACRILYAGYDGYQPATKATLLAEARHVLRAAQTTITTTTTQSEQAPQPERAPVRERGIADQVRVCGAAVDRARDAVQVAERVHHADQTSQRHTDQVRDLPAADTGLDSGLGSGLGSGLERS